MARHKEFARDQALAAAIRVFSDHGYEGTSTDDLLKAMRISRQSMYDTFGDKRGLYLEALQQYNADSVSRLIADINSEGSPRKGIEAALITFASRPEDEARRCCLGVSAICEFGRTDSDVVMLTDSASRVLASAIETILRDGVGQGEFAADLDIKMAVLFLGSILSGMKVSARNGASPDALRGIARLALKSLS